MTNEKDPFDLNLDVDLSIPDVDLMNEPIFDESVIPKQSNDVPRKGWTPKQKEIVRERQKGRCADCNKPPPRWEYHHEDGDRSNNNLDNCVGLCPNCHSVREYDE